MGDDLRSVKDVRLMMGTFVTIIAEHPVLAKARAAVSAAFDEMQRIHALMSVHAEGSEVSALNREGRCPHPSIDTRFVLTESLRFSALSGGAFDITVLPVVRLWQSAIQRRCRPTEAEIHEALCLVSFRDVIVEDEGIQLRRPGAGVTLAAVAKGYAVDRAVEVLRRCGIQHALVNAGGDIRAYGGKAPSVPWRVGVRDSRDRSRMLRVFDVFDGAVATSGVYNRPTPDIVDPRTGWPAEGVTMATALAATALEADVMATTLYVLGVTGGQQLLQKLEEVRALMTTRDGAFHDLS